jgi:hypothetical protein
VRELEAAVAALIEATGTADAVETERARRRDDAAEKSRQRNEDMSAATRAASAVNQRRPR